MRIKSAPVPTPITGMKGKAPNPVVAPAVTPPQPEAEPMTVRMGSTVHVELHRNEMAKVVHKMNETARIFNVSLRFEMVENQRVVVKVIDTDSNEVIREIPPEKLMDAFTRLEDMVGLLLDWRG